jgi:hypothetical protein
MRVDRKEKDEIGKRKKMIKIEMMKRGKKMKTRKLEM